MIVVASTPGSHMIAFWASGLDSLTFAGSCDNLTVVFDFFCLFLAKTPGKGLN